MILPPTIALRPGLMTLLGIAALAASTVASGAAPRLEAGLRARPMGRPATGPTAAEALRLEVVDQLGGRAFDVALEGDRAYMALGRRLVVLDVSDPAAIRQLGRSALLESYLRHIMTLGGGWVVGASAQGSIPGLQRRGPGRRPRCRRGAGPGAGGPRRPHICCRRRSHRLLRPDQRRAGAGSRAGPGRSSGGDGGVRTRAGS